jgi:hypothetical protein
MKLKERVFHEKSIIFLKKNFYKNNLSKKKTKKKLKFTNFF